MSGEGASIEENAEKTILIVDDEENILRALVRLLRRDGYTILTASSGQQGLDLLKNNSVGVILSDQRMPEMSGIEFLSQVKQLYPDTIRIVLSGYTDLNSVTDAINRGSIYKFLTKPWEDDLLRENITKGFNHFSLAQENKRLNSELKRLNEILENRVVEQNRESKIESHILKITRQVMNQQGVGVLGISDEHMIVVANEKAHEILSVSPGSLISMDASQVLKGITKNCYENIISDCSDEVIHGMDADKKIITRRMTPLSGTSGVVITLIPIATES